MAAGAKAVVSTVKKQKKMKMVLYFLSYSFRDPGPGFGAMRIQCVFPPQTSQVTPLQKCPWMCLLSSSKTSQIDKEDKCLLS